MATRKFLTSVADVFGYDSNDNIVFTGKTLLDSSIEVSLGSAPVRGGRGNQLQYIYYHTGEMKFTLTDTQWNLQMLGATVGSDIATGESVNNYVYEEESVTITTKSGTVAHTPLAFSTGGTIYGWVSYLGVSYKVVIDNSTKNFTVSEAPSSIDGKSVCVRYYTENAVSNSITIQANMIPKIVKLVMETQLNSADVSTNRIGYVQIVAPTVTLSGAFTLSMKSDGVSNTPLTATALAYNDTTAGCTAEPYYAKITEVITDANWYDTAIDLAVACSDTIVATNSTGITPTIYAILANRSTAVVSTALSFTKLSGTGFTIDGTSGKVTTSAASGTAVFQVETTGGGVPTLTASWAMEVSA